MRKAFAKWEVKTRLFSRRKTLAGNCCGLVKALIPITDREGLWRGHRTLLIDGSAFSMPDTPELQSPFGQPGGQKPGCGFPGGQDPGGVPCRYRGAVEGHGHAVALA